MHLLRNLSLCPANYFIALLTLVYCSVILNMLSVFRQVNIPILGRKDEQKRFTFVFKNESLMFQRTAASI
jgi:hypothetical protein